MQVIANKILSKLEPSSPIFISIKEFVVIVIAEANQQEN